MITANTWRSVVKISTMITKNKKITIVWGTDKNKTKSYTFKNEEEAKFFMMGVDEGNGWLEYEAGAGWFD